MMDCNNIDVHHTNDEATACKAFAVRRGYWTDSYIHHFITKPPDRKPPEISRGYYARVAAVFDIVNKFIELVGSENAQIINLGAGYDTLFWRLYENNKRKNNADDDNDDFICRFVEVDLPIVTSNKCRRIKRYDKLIEAINSEDGEIQFCSTDLHSQHYHLVSCDIRNLESLKEKLLKCDIDFSGPVLFIAECVLIYIESQRSAEILKWITSTFKNPFFFNYEQVNMNDQFGDIMLSNLKTRNCVLSGIEPCESLSSQINRFLSNGFKKSDAITVMNFYQMVPSKDLQRIERLEMLDERELLEQLFSHYCFCWSFNDENGYGYDKLTLHLPKCNADFEMRT